MIVSVIQSIYRDFGSGVVGGDTGIILQNRGAFFTLDERRPNNLQPGKRPFHTLARDGKPYLAFGSMGGEGQPQSQAALVTRILDFGYGVREAIERRAGSWVGPGVRDLATLGSNAAPPPRSSPSSSAAASGSASFAD